MVSEHSFYPLNHAIRYISSAGHIPSSLPLNWCNVSDNVLYLYCRQEFPCVAPFVSDLWAVSSSPLPFAQISACTLRTQGFSYFTFAVDVWCHSSSLAFHSACFDWLRHWNRLPLRRLSLCITKKWLSVTVSARSWRYLIHWKTGDSKLSAMCQRSKLPVVLTSRVLLFYNYIFYRGHLFLDIPLACHGTCQRLLLCERLKIIKPQRCTTGPTLFILI